tara:strand:- start:1749 stop:2105 length:357 start_codon:yes stop_codon:yes gene_type:complete
MQLHVENPYTQKKYRLQDILGTCTGNSLNLILFKNIEQDPSSPIHKGRVMTADTRYPILVALKNNKYLIVDGNHRYLKMRAQKKTACVAFVVTQENFDKVKDSWDSYPAVRLCGGCSE